MKLYLTKQGNGSFMPSYGSDHEAAKKIKTGNTVECEIKQSRNILFHRKYFALLNLVYENQEVYQNLDHLRHDLTLEAGFYDVRYNIHGEEIKQVKSISFASMSEFEFNELYSKTLDVIVKYFKFEREEIEENIERYF